MRHSARGPRPFTRRRCVLATLAWPAAWTHPARAARPAAAPPRLAQLLPRTLTACGLPPTHLGLCVATVDDGEELAQLHADQPFVLASTAKLVTSLAALELLGPRWRWRTHAFATGPLEHGRVRGDLLVVGGGDPTLSPDDLRQWLQTLRQRGLQRVQGDLVLDRSAFNLHEEDHAGTPTPAPDRPHHARPDALAGLAPQAVAALWRGLGGEVGGSARDGDLTAGRPTQPRLPIYDRDGELVFPLSTHPSAPLPELVHEINKNSDNVGARHLMLSLAPGFPAQAATLAKARERLRDWLQRQGLTPADIELDNGSGLSRAERGRPRAMVQLLRRAWASRVSRDFVESLPVAGVDGTLAHRLQHGAAAGQAFLKTGTLLDTRALAGYVRARSGRVLAVAVMAHHPDAARATTSIDAVIEQIARQG